MDILASTLPKQLTLGSEGCDSNLALRALRGGGGLDIDIKTASDTCNWADSVLSGKKQLPQPPAWPQQHEPPAA